MTETRTARFHDLDTSRLQNRQLAGIVRAGVYAGFKVRPNTSDRSKLDITRGNDSTSILLTSEGVKIEETTDLYGAVALKNADNSLTRIDLIVAEYQFTTDQDVGVEYKAIRGRYPSSSSVSPVAPDVENAYQVPLAMVYVRPRTTSGTPKAQVETADVIHVGRGIDVRAPLDISSFMPIVAPSEARRIFVHEGIMPTFDGTGTIEFPGGYSDIIDPDTLSDGESAYYLFGVDDDGDVVLIGTADTREELPAFTRDIFPVCSVKGTKVPASGAITLSDLFDLRFPFARQLDPQDEAGPYKSALAGSVFDHMRVELFRNISGIVTNTLSDDSVTMEIDRGTTSLNFSADTDPSDEVTVVTKNMLRDTSIGNVQHFMMIVDASFDGLEIRFSTTSPYSGFVSARSSPNEIVRIPSGGGSQLYVQFIIPAAAFAGGQVPKIYSYGCLMVLNENVVNVNTVSDVGIDSLKNSVPNLIANGNFRHWSRDDINGNPTDVDSQVDIVYPSDADNPFAADGWQFTQFTFEAESGQIRRKGLTNEVLGGSVSNPSDTALYWEGSAGTGALGTNVLEYRVPVPPASSGRRVTFGCSYLVNSISNIAIGIALYELTPQGTLQIQNVITPVAASVVQGDLLAVSDLAINERTFAIGFLVYLTQGTGTTSVALWNARAAIGEFRTLPYNEEVNATDILRKYYERGRIFISNNTTEGQQIGTSIQFGAKKHTGLGTLVAQTIAEADSDRSLNVDAPVYDPTPDGVTVTANSTSGGLARIDVDFESFIKYQPVI